MDNPGSLTSAAAGQSWPLAEAFTSALAPALAAGLRPEALEPGLAALLAHGRREWPEVRVDDIPFVQFVAARFDRAPSPADLDELSGTDLYLCCGALLGDAVALDVLNTRIVDAVRVVARRANRESIDEVAQTIRVKLLVGSTPRLHQYGGRGSLDAWLRVVANRSFLDALRHTQRRREDPIEEPPLAGVASIFRSPELEQVRGRYRVEFRAALTDAIESLTPRQRNVLRQHFFQHLSPAQIATFYRVDRSTVARWIASAKEQVLSATRRALRRRLGDSFTSLDSVMEVVASQLSITLEPLFRAQDPPSDD